MPTVSVIVPNYNHARYLPQRMESILRQTYQDFELILLDDCSTDDSRSILSGYANDPRVQLEFNEVNSGSTFKQWNKGVRLARGKYVWIAESDDYADERLLETLVSRLEAEPTAVLVNCRSWIVSADDHRVGVLDGLADLDPLRWTTDFSADGREECRKYLIFGNSVQSASSVVFRREVYWQVGGADETLVFAGDWKTWAAMALTGGTIAHVGQVLNYYRLHDTTVTARAQRLGLGTAEWLRVTRWFLERVTPDTRVYNKLCRNLSYVWAPAILNRRIPSSVRRSILKDAKIIDPHVLRRLRHPVARALRMTMAGCYHWLGNRFLSAGARAAAAEARSRRQRRKHGAV